MKTGKQLPRWAIAALFPAVLFYYEIVLRIATGHGFPTVGTVYMALFCLGYGAIGYLLATLFKKKKVSYIVTLVYLIVTAAPFSLSILYTGSSMCSTTSAPASTALPMP